MSAAFVEEQACDEEMVSFTQEVRKLIRNSADLHSKLDSISLTYLTEQEAEVIIQREQHIYNTELEDQVSSKSSLRKAVMGGIVAVIICGFIRAVMQFMPHSRTIVKLGLNAYLWR